MDQPGPKLQRAVSMDSPTEEAVHEVSHYHAPTKEQAGRHKNLSEAVEEFIACIINNCEPSLERSSAIAKAREAKMWASAAIAVNEEGET